VTPSEKVTKSFHTANIGVYDHVSAIQPWRSRASYVVGDAEWIKEELFTRLPLYAKEWVSHILRDEAASER
jgi:hypothetical protein